MHPVEFEFIKEVLDKCYADLKDRLGDNYHKQLHESYEYSKKYIETQELLDYYATFRKQFLGSAKEHHCFRFHKNRYLGDDLSMYDLFDLRDSFKENLVLFIRSRVILEFVLHPHLMAETSSMPKHGLSDGDQNDKKQLMDAFSSIPTHNPYGFD